MPCILHQAVKSWCKELNPVYQLSCYTFCWSCGNVKGSVQESMFISAGVRMKMGQRDRSCFI